MKNSLLILFLALFLVNCKDKNPDPIAKTNLEYLTGDTVKGWKLKDGTAKKGSLEVNLIATQNPCITDNIIKLYKDFSYEFTEGATKCNAQDADLIVKSNWTLSTDQKQISISKFIFLGRTVNNPVFNINSITDDTFSGSTKIVLDGESYTITVVFQRV